MTDGNHSHYGDHFPMCTNTKSLVCTPEYNIIFKLFLNKAIKFFSAFKLMFVDSVCDWVLSDTHSI